MSDLVGSMIVRGGFVSPIILLVVLRVVVFFFLFWVSPPPPPPSWSGIRTFQLSIRFGLLLFLTFRSRLLVDFCFLLAVVFGIPHALL